jgi:hypothetical protein
MSRVGSGVEVSDAVRSTTMQHVAPAAVKSFETSNNAQALYMNSMRIALDPIATTTPVPLDTSCSGVLRVELRIDLTKWTSVQHTLTMHVAPDLVKRFVFQPVFDGSTATLPGVIKIPCSARRPTSVEIRCYNDGAPIDVAEARSSLLDMQESKPTALDPCVTISGSADRYRFYTAMRRQEKAFTFTFLCYTYEADAPTHMACNNGYSIKNAFSDWQSMLANPVITPSHPVSVVSSKQAAVFLTDFEKSVDQLHGTFDNIFLETVCQELGATAEDAADVKRAVDWAHSYTVSTDVGVQAIISAAKDIYTELTTLSNSAVDSAWLRDEDVLDMVQARKQLTDSVRGRRTELGDVVRVRSKFLCVDAVDSMLRTVCSNTEHPKSDEIATMLEMPCHRYWLEQMKANYCNSVALDEESYVLASSLIDRCTAARSAGPLLPRLASLKSSLGHKLWQSMHLQGLAATHALPVAPCAHFMYKKRARVDYSQHPLVQQAPSASLALLTMLVSTDVEHRIIPPALGAHILSVVETATAQGACDSTKKQASAFLKRLLHSALHSLADCALQAPHSTEPPDMSFITNADAQSASTGYDMQEVQAFCVLSVLAGHGDNCAR